MFFWGGFNISLILFIKRIGQFIKDNVNHDATTVAHHVIFIYIY